MARTWCIVAWGPGLGQGLGPGQALGQGLGPGLAKKQSSNTHSHLPDNTNTLLPNAPPGNHILIFDAFDLTCLWANQEPTMPFFRGLVGVHTLRVDHTLRLALASLGSSHSNVNDKMNDKTRKMTTAKSSMTSTMTTSTFGKGNKAGLESEGGSGVGSAAYGMGCTLIQVSNTRLPSSSSSPLPLSLPLSPLPEPSSEGISHGGGGGRGDGGVGSMSMDLCTIAAHHIEEILAISQNGCLKVSLVGHCVLPVSARLSCVVDDRPGLGPGLGQGLGSESNVMERSGGGGGGWCGQATVVLCNDNTLRIIDVGQGQGQSQSQSSGSSRSASSGNGNGSSQGSGNGKDNNQDKRDAGTSPHTGGVVTVVSVHTLSGYATPSSMQHITINPFITQVQSLT